MAFIVLFDIGLMSVRSLAGCIQVNSREAAALNHVKRINPNIFNQNHDVNGRDNLLLNESGDGAGQFHSRV